MWVSPPCLAGMNRVIKELAETDPAQSGVQRDNVSSSDSWIDSQPQAAPAKGLVNSASLCLENKGLSRDQGRMKTWLPEVAGSSHLGLRTKRHRREPEMESVTARLAPGTGPATIDCGVTAASLC